MQNISESGKAAASTDKSSSLPQAWTDPPKEFSQAPFWFWNDDLSENELSRQIADFQEHGVHAFVIHPRAGLPATLGWMSDRMLELMRFAVEQATQRGMWVLLYDEGMYPSGSSSGQVVAENVAYRTRGLVAVDLDEAAAGSVVHGVSIGPDGVPDLGPGQTLVATTPRKTDGHRIAVVDRAAAEGYSVIRGLHFVDQDAERRRDRREVPENLEPAADILNPEAVDCFIRLVYQRYYDELHAYFGTTIKGIFTDEPSLLAKRPEPGMVPGTTGILEHVNDFLGYDFSERLPGLWYDNEPEAAVARRDYHRALQSRLEETFYRRLSTWCEAHGVALTGHPSGPDDIGHLRHFQIPGQDIVWRYIEPGKPTALEGAQSTQAKCASSAMIHLGRRRNLNEYCGAYGHEFNFDEMQWLANWLLIRGCNLLAPHAFFYSVRGPRIDERPPDVGPNSPWWPQFKAFADATSRLCLLNTDSTHVCELAILGLSDDLPWRAAKVCFQHQRDFNYLEARHLWEDAQVDESGVSLAGMHYRAIVIEVDPPEAARAAIDILEKSGRIIRWNERMPEIDLVERIDELLPVDVRITPAAPDMRVRHVRKDGNHYFLLFNEGARELRLSIELAAVGSRTILDPVSVTAEKLEDEEPVTIPAHAMRVVRVVGS